MFRILLNRKNNRRFGTVVFAILTAAGCALAAAGRSGTERENKAVIILEYDTMRCDAAESRLKALGADFIRSPEWQHMIVSLHHWRGDETDLLLLADIPRLKVLWLGPTQKESFRICEKLRDLIYVDVSDAELSTDEVAELRRMIPHVEVYNNYESPQLRQLDFTLTGEEEE